MNMTKTGQELAYNHYMETEMGNYMGEWVAVSEDTVLSHGTNLKEVVEKAKLLAKGKKFIIAKVPSQETMIF